MRSWLEAGARSARAQVGPRQRTYAAEIGDAANSTQVLAGRPSTCVAVWHFVAPLTGPFSFYASMLHDSPPDTV